MSELRHSSRPERTLRSFPSQLFLIAVAAVCLGIALSAVFTYRTLMRLRAEYFENRGYEIAAAIDSQVRGRGRRDTPSFWKGFMDEGCREYASSVGFMALLDGSGRLLASSGAVVGAEPGFVRDGELFIFDLPLSSPRHSQSGQIPTIAGWRLRVGLYTVSGESIRRQAALHLWVSGTAVLALAVLSLFLIRTLKRYVRLREQEASQRHLRALGTMSAALAHEIRNPLGAIKGLSQLAQEEIPVDHPAQASLNTVVGETERLEKLVTDLLDFARPKDLHLEEFDLVPLISEVRELVRTRLQESDVKLEIEPGAGSLRVRSDRHGLRQVLLNLLFNALDASPRGGAVRLRMAPDRVEKQVLVDVVDAGAGLGERDPEELFQPFVTTKVRGTGLGLPVSRQIMHRLGGSLSLENLPAGGARCRIRLPLLTGHPAASEESGDGKIKTTP